MSKSLSLETTSDLTTKEIVVEDQTEIYADESINFNNEEYDYISSMDYNVRKKFLNLEIKHYSRQRKITKYIQKNYQKFPVYGAIKVKENIIRKISKKINPIRFLEEELIEFNISSEIRTKIVDYMIKKTGYSPGWYLQIGKVQKFDKIVDTKNEEIVTQQLLLSKLSEDTKEMKDNIENKKSHYNSVISKLPIKKSSVGTFLLYGILSFILIGFILFSKFYISRKKAEKNRIKREEFLHDIQNDLSNLNIWYENIPKEETKYLEKIRALSQEIKLYQMRIASVSEEKPSTAIDDNGFYNLRVHSSLTYRGDFIGIYIIWNKTRNKYYVGQSINVNKRLFRDHFVNGEVQNVVFAKDWWKKHQFFFKTIECEREEELDQLEREYIKKYDSYQRGYNKNSGNS